LSENFQVPGQILEILGPRYVLSLTKDI
jgi:hypothetical protein